MNFNEAWPIFKNYILSVIKRLGLRRDYTIRHFDILKARDVHHMAKKLRNSIGKDDHLTALVHSIAAEIPNEDKNIAQIRNTKVSIEVDRIAKEIEALNDFSRYRFDKDVWLILANVLLLGFHFRASFICCQQALKSTQERLETSGSRFSGGGKFLEIMWLAIENNDESVFDKIGNILLDTKQRTRNRVYPSYAILGLLLRGRDTYRKMSAQTIATKEELAFAEYVRGKSIALVGPVDNGLASGKEIENFDIVIRFNHHDKSVYPRGTFGSRTDISYYTQRFFDTQICKRRKILRGLKFAVVSNFHKLRHYKRVAQNLTARASYLKGNYIFFKSRPNAVQRTLIDLMRFDTGRIKVFNVNFWLTPHDQRYLAGRDFVDPEMFILHDCATNFKFVQKLLRANLIEVDTRIDEILEMTAEQYIDRLEDNASFIAWRPKVTA